MKKDWEIKKLGDVCLKRDSIKWKNENSNTEYQYIDLSAVDRESKNIIDTQIITKENAPSRAQQIVRTGDILFGTTRPTLKRFSLLSDDYDGQICSTGFCVLRPNQKTISSNWIFYQFYDEKFYKYIEPLQKGANYPAVTDKDIFNFPIPVPPLEEQKRIVKILDEKFAQLETIKAKAQTNLQNAKDLFQSQLTKAFSNTTWEKKKFSELFKLSSGDYLNSKSIVKGEYPIYGGNGIIDYHKEYNLTGDNIIIGRVGALCGNVRYISEPIWLTDNAFKLTFIDFKYDYAFITYLLNHINLRSFARQAAQPVISNSSLKDIEIPLPPLPEQKRIVAELDTLSEKVRQLQEIYTKQIINCADLKQSLLQKAFEGEL